MIERAPFGATGHESSRVIFGAAALARASKADADRTLELLVAARHQPHRYRGRLRRRRAAPRAVAAAHRDDFFLATKTGERRYAAANEQIQRSLERLRRRPRRPDPAPQPRRRDEWEIALSPGGALEAAVEARDEGLVRFIGVTGHGMPSPRCTRAASRASTSTPCCCPYNYVHDAEPALRRDFDACRDVRGARRRGADDQVDRARAVGRAASTRARPGTSR